MVEAQIKTGMNGVSRAKYFVMLVLLHIVSLPLSILAKHMLNFIPNGKMWSTIDELYQ
jgi:hypothetical protein